MIDTTKKNIVQRKVR